ncbi:MAG TPA: hypothetical protein PKA98_05875, partial [Acidimicrobiales bacterium]|nr:hypothetical protein [Acidimicrobiales bacterium]
PPPPSPRGPSATPPRPEGAGASRRFAARIEDAVAALADETATNWYEARVRAHRRANPTLAGPEVAKWRRAWAAGPTRRDAKRKRRWPL